MTLTGKKAPTLEAGRKTMLEAAWKPLQSDFEAYLLDFETTIFTGNGATLLIQALTVEPHCPPECVKLTGTEKKMGALLDERCSTAGSLWRGRRM